MCGLSVYFNVEAPVIFSVNSTDLEGQTISSNILLSELDVTVHCIDVFCKAFLFLCFDFDPGVTDVPQLVARSCSCEGDQGSALFSLTYIV